MCFRCNNYDLGIKICGHGWVYMILSAKQVWLKFQLLESFLISSTLIKLNTDWFCSVWTVNEYTKKLSSNVVVKFSYICIELTVWFLYNLILGCFAFPLVLTSHIFLEFRLFITALHLLYLVNSWIFKIKY